MKKRLLTLIAFASFAATATSAVQAEQIHDVYLGLGMPGVATVGFSVPIFENWRYRAEAATGLDVSMDGHRDGVDFTGNIKGNRLGTFFDYFPINGSGFRFAGGLTINHIKVNLNAVSTGTAVINDKTVNMTGQNYNVKITFPHLTPYVGVGYGHRKAEKGFGFYADVGVMIGKFFVDTNTSLVANRLVTQDDIDAQSQKLRDGVSKVGVFPSVSVGALYRF